MEEIIERLRKFTEDRDWAQFHSPENLAKSVSIEAGELLECFQWSGDFEMDAVKDEVADVMTYCIMLCDRLGIDIEENIMRKISLNEAKYPVEKSRGNSAKYTEL